MIDVCLLPSQARPEQLAGQTVVVIDVLRATTTIAQALASGAKEVIPCLHVEDARQLAEDRGRQNVLLGGERGGLLIEGFDLGNSPRDYTPQRVANRTLIFTTTNGTAALLHCRQAERILLASLANCAAIADAVKSAARLTIVCAGTRGLVTREDIFAAGAIVERLESTQDQPPELTPTAVLARATWQHVAKPGGLAGQSNQADSAAIIQAMRETLGGRDLIALGLDLDIADASQLDSLQSVPAFDPSDEVIRGLQGLPPAQTSRLP